MLCHIFSNTLKQKAQWMLPLCPGKFSTVIRTHTHTVAATIKRALPVWVLHLVSVFSTDYDGSGVSLLVVLMWRDDTCGSWIERHKGFQIENMEWCWGRVLFLLLFCQEVSLAQISLRTGKLHLYHLRKKLHSKQCRMPVSYWLDKMYKWLYLVNLVFTVNEMSNECISAIQSHHFPPLW